MQKPIQLRWLKEALLDNKDVDPSSCLREVVCLVPGKTVDESRLKK